MYIVQTRRGLFIDTLLLRKNQHELNEQFVMKKIIYKDKYKLYNFMKRINNYIRMPMFMLDYNEKVKEVLMINNIDISTRVNKMPALHDIECKYIGTAKTYQLVAFKYLLKHIFTPTNRELGRASCILRMNTGLGKTHMGMLLINALKVRTLIVLPPTGVLVEQWYKDLSSFMNAKIGIYDATHKEIDADILITMCINLVDPQEPLKSALASFSFTIYDEIHTFATNKRSNTFMNTFTHYRIGLTASFPDSYVNLEYLRYELGPKIDVNDIPFFQIDDVKFDAHVSLIYYYGDADYTKLIINPKTGIVSNAEMYKLISADMKRNRMILTILKWLYQRKIKTFVFFDDKESLYMFERILLEIDTFADPKLIVKAKTKMTKKEISHMNGAAKIILIIYGYGDTGLSVNDAYSAIWYHPRKSLIDQKSGRILRINSDLSARRYIFDIIDANTLYAHQAKIRCKEYDKREFKKYKIKVKDTLDMKYLELV